MNTDFKTTNVILKLLSFQQNDNELTVPMTEVIVWSLSSLKPKLKPEFHSFDYHQRVPTQIDRFKLLKSFAFKGLTSRADAYNTRLTL